LMRATSNSRRSPAGSTSTHQLPLIGAVAELHVVASW
jgi:hypothetical protein